jgi:ABC-type multidrug transport system fused ATPase/permease subunit
MERPTEVVWERRAGARVAVSAAPGSRASTRAELELQQADRVIEALADVLEMPRGADRPIVEIYLVDQPASGRPEVPGPGAAGEADLAPGDLVGDSGVVRVVRGGAEAEPIAWTLTRFVCTQWFGHAAGEAAPFVDGLAGVVAARSGTGPAVEVAHAWVRGQLTSGRPVSILSRGPGIAAEAVAGPSMVAPGPPAPEGDAAPPSAAEMGSPLGPGEIGAQPRTMMRPPEGGEPPPDAFLGEPVFEAPGQGPAGVPGPSPAPGPGAPTASQLHPTEQSRLAATSFVGHLVTKYRGESLRRVLEQFDPRRRDQAVVAVYQLPVGALEEEWLKSLRAEPKPQTLRSFVSYLLPMFRPYWGRQVEVLVYMLVGAVFAVISLPVAFGAVVGALSPGQADNQSGPIGALIGSISDWLRIEGRVSTTRLLVFAAALVAVYGLQTLITIRRGVVSETISQRLLISLQERMFGHLLRLPHSFFAEANVGDLMSRLSGDLQGVSTAMTGILNGGVFLLISVVTAAFSVVSLNLRLGLILIVTAPLFLISYKVLSKRLAAVSYERMVRTGDAAAVTQEILSAHSVVKAFGLEERSQAVYHGRLMQMLASALRLVRIQSLFEGGLEVAMTIAQVIIIAYGGYLVAHGDMDLAVLIAFVAIVPALLLPISGFADIGEMIQTASGSLARVTELLDQPLPISDRPDATELPPLQREIRMERFTFGYTPDKPIFQDLNLAIAAGEKVAIVGPSGSGKSTVINLILRFWDPWDGRILFDGKDIREATLASLRGQIGLVFQDTFIFDTTIRENIAIGRPGASDEEIVSAARGAQLDAWIDSLPAAYETVLGERGVRMSGGQRQRLAIARVLLRDPRVMILDEATSALDAQTEAEIMQTLEQASRGRTTITITHRLSLAAGADRIVVVDQGRLVEEGTHAELLAAGGLYQRLYETQTAYATAGRSPGGLDPERLRAIPLFAGLGEEELAAVGGRLRAERLPAGAVVVRQGERGDRLYLMGSGQAEAVVTADGGPERRVGLLGEGDFFGEMALLSNETRNATVRTTLPSEVYHLTRGQFERLLEENPGLAETVNRIVSQRAAALDAAALAVGVARER